MDSESLSRYLPSDQQAKAWGWRLVGAGRQKVPPNGKYPRPGHPAQYLFDDKGGRILDEYQIVFIAEGAGTFESASFSSSSVHAGQVLILFPGEWHRYRPDLNTGWTEYWLGFRGSEAERIMSVFFSRSNPLFSVGRSDALHQHFTQMLGWLQQSTPSKEQILASHIPLALALVGPGLTGANRQDKQDSELVRRSKSAMLASLGTTTDLKKLAEELGVSYSRFRFTFKKQTGFAPRAFENIIKLNRAKDLLLREKLSVGETADALGYSSVYYFSRTFKKQFKYSPQQWLQRQKHGHSGNEPRIRKSPH